MFVLLEVAGFVAFGAVGVKPVAGYGYPTGLRIDDERLGWLSRPGFRGYFKGNLAYLDIPIRINSAGFRDQELAAKPAGRQRLVVVGDSVVFGPGVAAEDRFMEQLQGRAGQLAWPLEVRNLGVSGYTFAQYVDLARLDFLGVQPDGVLLGFTLNDIADDPRPRGERMPVDGRLANTRRRLGRAVDWFERSYASRFVDELSMRINLLANGADDGDYPTRWMNGVVGAWRNGQAQERLGRELDEFNDRLAAAGIPFAVVIFPELNDVLQPQRFSYPRQTIRAMLEARQIAYCDPYAAFQTRGDVRDLFLSNESVHYTPAGHALLADVLLDCLRSGHFGSLGAALGAPAPDSADRRITRPR